MVSMAEQMKVKRIIKGVRIPHPAGDPELSPESDLALRKEIVKKSLEAIQAKVDQPTIFVPEMAAV